MPVVLEAPSVAETVIKFVQDGFQILTQGMTNMLDIPIVVGMLGVTIACVIGRRAIRLIKYR